jgi:hypothetical protein
LFEIDGPTSRTEYDQIVISGLAQFDGGLIQIDVGNGFLPSDRGTFDLISAVLGLSNSGVPVDIQALPAGFVLEDQFTPNGLDVAVTATPTAPTPEPTSLILFVTALAALAICHVFYIVRATDPETKQPKNVLVRRGKEWHAPMETYLNAQISSWSSPLAAALTSPS